ncbi:MAG: hypothetical protein ACI9CA_002286 [Natronomonas sp.]|jgi:hypothetical protein
MDVDEHTEDVLQVLAHGRSNSHHLCQQTGRGEQAVAETLAACSAAGLVTEVDRDLYQITSAGVDQLDRDYPAEAGFLQETGLIHDAPTIKTVRLRGDRGLVEVQVDDDSVADLADTVVHVLSDTHGDIEPLRAALRQAGVNVGEDRSPR